MNRTVDEGALRKIDGLIAVQVQRADFVNPGFKTNDFVAGTRFPRFRRVNEQMQRIVDAVQLKGVESRSGQREPQHLTVPFRRDTGGKRTDDSRLKGSGRRYGHCDRAVCRTGGKIRLLCLIYRTLMPRPTAVEGDRRDRGGVNRRRLTVKRYSKCARKCLTYRNRINMK